VSVQVPTVTLNNGVEMPILGFGVFQIPAEATEQAVLTEEHLPGREAVRGQHAAVR